MSRVLRLREVSDEEAKQLRQLSTSRTEPARLVQRAKIIQLLLDTPKLSRNTFYEAVSSMS